MVDMGQLNIRFAYSNFLLLPFNYQKAFSSTHTGRHTKAGYRLTWRRKSRHSWESEMEPEFAAQSNMINLKTKSEYYIKMEIMKQDKAQLE